MIIVELIISFPVAAPARIHNLILSKPIEILIKKCGIDSTVDRAALPLEFAMSESQLAIGEESYVIVDLTLDSSGGDCDVDGEGAGAENRWQVPRNTPGTCMDRRLWASSAHTHFEDVPNFSSTR